MKSRLLNTLWHFTLPNLGVDAQRQQAIRAMVYRLLLKEDRFSHALRQIRAIMACKPELLTEVSACLRTAGGPVIIWTMRGGLQVNTTEAIIGHALRLRGVDVRVVLCDEFLPACEQRAIHAYPQGRINQRTDRQICDRCRFNATQVFNAFELPVVTLSSLVTPQEVAIIQNRASQMSGDEALALEDGGINLGSEVRAFVNQFYRALRWPDSPHTTQLLRRGAAAALILRQASDRILEQERPRAVLTSHGIYLLWGVIKRVAQHRRIPVTVWGNGYRTGTLRLSRGNWFEAAIAEPVGAWEGLELTPERTQRLDDYLNNRWDGKRDRRALFESKDGENSLTPDRLGLESAKPTLGVFPNVAWDADLNFRDGAFQDMSEWLLETVRFIAHHPRLQAVVRAHPGEAITTTSERSHQVIMRHFPALPRNVVVLPAESKINTYALAGFVRAATVYGSQFGLELACRGVPVIVASECFYRAKGFTWDVNSREEYLELLGRLDTVQPLDDGVRQRARTYAYHYYFRRLTPFPYLTSENWSNLKDITLQSLDELLPGRNQHLDQIIEGILENRPVVLNV